MKKNIKYTKWIFFLLTILAITFASCKDDDDNSGKIILDVFGPSPSPRGGTLTFIGENMDKVSSVIFPNDIEISEIEIESSEKIKVVIPQNAVPGYVKLITQEGDIQTKTILSYSEPISISKMSATKIKAGQMLTLEGDYLNLVSKIIFADNVKVICTDFSTWERKKIILTVPMEAQTGRITLSDTTSIPVEIVSDTILQIILPAVSSVTTFADQKPDDVIGLIGTDLDLVESVLLPNDSVVDFTVADNTLTFIVPSGCADGEVDMVSYSGKAIAIANVTMAIPTEMTVTPGTGIKVDDEITITGTNMNLVTSVVFPGTTDAVTPNSISATEMKITMLATAISGDVTLNTASGNIAIIAIETQKPEVTNLSITTPAPSDELTITGTDLDLVSTITFGGDAIGEISSQSATEIVVSVPTFAENGVVTLTMANTEFITTEELEIQTPSYCYIANVPDTTINAGSIFAIDVENVLVLTDVQVAGTSTQYIINGSTLSILIPSSSNGTTEITLVSSNGSVSYEIDVAASGMVETILYSTLAELSEWSANFELNVDFSSAPSDSYVRIRYTKTIDNPQMKVMNGHWESVYDGTTDENAATLAGSDYIDLPVSLFPYSDWGYTIIIQGDGMIVSSISWVKDYSGPIAIWEGSAEVSSWSTSFTALTWGAYDFSGLTVGQTMYIYYTADAAATMRLGNGNWAALPSTIDIAIESGDTSGEGNIAIAAGTSSISFTLTAEDIASIQNSGGFGAYAGDYIVTKVAIK